MSDDEIPKNQWLADAIARAKTSALPILLQGFVDANEEDADLESTILAVELALLAINGDVTEEKLRGALRSIAEMYSTTTGATWESIADAILGTLEWTPPDARTHILDSWGGRR